MDQDVYDRSFSPQRPRSQISSEYSGASTAHPVEWQDDWILREGEFRDTINALQTEQERIQKKTFTNWINSHVEQNVNLPPFRGFFFEMLLVAYREEDFVCDQRISALKHGEFVPRNPDFLEAFMLHRDNWTVKNLFTDLKDGRILLALLEVITGDYLPCETFRHYTRAHYLSNVERALDYLRYRNIKLVNINSSDIVDGNETVILGLIWTIILNFQIDLDLAHLRENFLISPVPSGALNSSYDARSRSVSPSPTKKPRLAARGRFQAGASKAMLKWCQKEISDRYGVPITNLSTSWKDGMAFLGLVKVFDPNLVNLNDYRTATPAQRMNAAFSMAHERLGIPRFLDVADIDVERPDERSVMTYIAQFIKRFPDAKRNRQKMLMDSLPDLETIEASEMAEIVRIRDWCTDVLTMLKCLELTDDRPYEAYEEYKKFNQNFRMNISHYVRLKERYEEGRTIHITEENIAELDSLWARLISEKQIWHQHLFSPLQGQERLLCSRFEKYENELDQRVLLPPQRVTHYFKVNFEFRVQKHEDILSHLTHILDDLNAYLVREYPTEIFALHDLPSELSNVISDLERHLLEERCKLLIKRQLTLVDEWERRVERWEDFLQNPGLNIERLSYEYELNVIQERIFDKFLELSKRLQHCLELLQESPDSDKHQRAEFLSSAVNSNRRWKRVSERLYEIREHLRQNQTALKKKGSKLDLDYAPREWAQMAASSRSTVSPPAHLSSEKWSIYLQRVASFSRWLDRMERDFESVDREEVNRAEYQQGLHRFRALCNEVLDHKTDGQEIIDTFYACSAELPPTAAADETRKINRLIRRYDALIPSLEIVRSEVEHAVHSHQTTDIHRETVQLVPGRPDSVREHSLRVQTPAEGALSPTMSLGTSGYATPEFENALLRRSEPNTPSESFNRSPPFAYGISSQSSMNDGSPVEVVSVRDIEEDARRSVSVSSPRGVMSHTPSDERTFVRNVPVGDESSAGTSQPFVAQKPRVMFSNPERNVDDLSSDEDNSGGGKRQKSSESGAQKMRPSRKVLEEVDETTTESTVRTSQRHVKPTEEEGSKFSALRATFEKPNKRAAKSTVPKKGSVYEALRRKSQEKSSDSDDDQSGDSHSTSTQNSKKRTPVHTSAGQNEAISTFVRANDEEPSNARQRPTGIVFESHISDADIENALKARPASPPSVSEKPKYLRNIKTTTLVTSKETKSVKLIHAKSPPSDDNIPFVGSGRMVGKIKHPAVFTETAREETDIKPSEKVERPPLSAARVPSSSESSTETFARSRPSEEGTASKKTGTSPSTPDSDIGGKKSPFGFLKKKHTKTEFEETTQTVKRVTVSPITSARRHNQVEPAVPQTVVRDVPEAEVASPSREDTISSFVTDTRKNSTTTVVRETDSPAETYVRDSVSSESMPVGRESRRRSSDAPIDTGYTQMVRVVPYGASQTKSNEPNPQKVNRLTDLFERATSDPTLLAPEPTTNESGDGNTVARRSETPSTHVSTIDPIQLYVEKEETYPLHHDYDLRRQSVTETVKNFEEIFAPLDSVPIKFDTADSVTPTMVRPLKVSESPMEVEREVVESETTEERKPAKRSIFAGIFRSKKVVPEMPVSPPETETDTMTYTSSETSQSSTFITNEKKHKSPRIEFFESIPDEEPRNRPGKVVHSVGVSDSTIESEILHETVRKRDGRVGLLDLPSDVQEFLRESTSEKAIRGEPMETNTYVRETLPDIRTRIREFEKEATSVPPTSRNAESPSIPTSETIVASTEIARDTGDIVAPKRGVRTIISAFETTAQRDSARLVPDLETHDVDADMFPPLPQEVLETQTFFVETEPRHRPDDVRHFAGVADETVSPIDSHAQQTPTVVMESRREVDESTSSSQAPFERDARNSTEYLVESVERTKTKKPSRQEEDNMDVSESLPAVNRYFPAEPVPRDRPDVVRHIAGIRDETTPSERTLSAFPVPPATVVRGDTSRKSEAKKVPSQTCDTFVRPTSPAKVVNSEYLLENVETQNVMKRPKFEQVEMDLEAATFEKPRERPAAVRHLIGMSDERISSTDLPPSRMGNPQHSAQSASDHLYETVEITKITSVSPNIRETVIRSGEPEKGDLRSTMEPGSPTDHIESQQMLQSESDRNESALSDGRRSLGSREQFHEMVTPLKHGEPADEVVLSYAITPNPRVPVLPEDMTPEPIRNSYEFAYKISGEPRNRPMSVPNREGLSDADIGKENHLYGDPFNATSTEETVTKEYIPESLSSANSQVQNAALAAVDEYEANKISRKQENAYAVEALEERVYRESSVLDVPVVTVPEPFSTYVRERTAQASVVHPSTGKDSDVAMRVVRSRVRHSAVLNDEYPREVAEMRDERVNGASDADQSGATAEFDEDLVERKRPAPIFHFVGGGDREFEPIYFRRKESGRPPEMPLYVEGEDQNLIVPIKEHTKKSTPHIEVLEETVVKAETPDTHRHPLVQESFTLESKRPRLVLSTIFPEIHEPTVARSATSEGFTVQVGHHRHLPSNIVAELGEKQSTWIENILPSDLSDIYPVRPPADDIPHSVEIPSAAVIPTYKPETKHFDAGPTIKKALKPAAFVHEEETVVKEYRPSSKPNYIRSDPHVGTRVLVPEDTIIRYTEQSGIVEAPSSATVSQHAKVTEEPRRPAVSFKDEKDVKTEVKIRPRVEKVTHFTPMSDRAFENKLFAGTTTERKEKVFVAHPESSSVCKKVRIFEDERGIEYGRAAEERVLDLSSRFSEESTPSLYNRSPPPQSNQDRSSSSVFSFLRPKEKVKEVPKKKQSVTILESMGISPQSPSVQMENVRGWKVLPSSITGSMQNVSSQNRGSVPSKSQSVQNLSRSLPVVEVMEELSSKDPSRHRLSDPMTLPLHNEDSAPSDTFVRPSTKVAAKRAPINLDEQNFFWAYPHLREWDDTPAVPQYAVPESGSPVVLRHFWPEDHEIVAVSSEEMDADRRFRMHYPDLVEHETIVSVPQERGDDLTSRKMAWDEPSQGSAEARARPFPIKHSAGIKDDILEYIVVDPHVSDEQIVLEGSVVVEETAPAYGLDAERRLISPELTSIAEELANVSRSLNEVADRLTPEPRRSTVPQRDFHDSFGRGRASSIPQRDLDQFVQLTEQFKEVVDQFSPPPQTYVTSLAGFPEENEVAVENTGTFVRDLREPKPVTIKTKYEDVQVESLPSPKKIKSEEVFSAKIPTTEQSPRRDKEILIETVSTQKIKQPGYSVELAPSENFVRDEDRNEPDDSHVREADALNRDEKPTHESEIIIGRHPGVIHRVGEKDYLVEGFASNFGEREIRDKSNEMPEGLDELPVGAVKRLAERYEENLEETVRTEVFPGKCAADHVNRAVSEENFHGRRITDDRSELLVTDLDDLGPHVPVRESVSVLRVKDSEQPLALDSAEDVRVSDQDIQEFVTSRENDPPLVTPTFVRENTEVSSQHTYDISDDDRPATEAYPSASELPEESVTRSTIPPASHVGVSGLPRDEFVDSDLLGHSVVVPEDLEDEHPRTRPACLIRPFNISDREVGDYISDRPRFTTHISETDLAPRRRSSAAPPPEREADEPPAQPYPWQAQPVPTTQPVEPSATIVRGTTTVTTAEPQTSSRRTSSSSSIFEQVIEKSEKSAGDPTRKKSGFFGIFGKEKKPSLTVISSSESSTASTSVPTTSRYTAPDQNTAGSPIVRDANPVVRASSRVPNDTVEELIYGPKVVRQPEVVEELQSPVSAAKFTVVERNRSEQDFPIYHHPGFPDRDVEPLVENVDGFLEHISAAKSKPIPADTFIQSSPFETSEREAGSSITVAGYPADEEKISRSSSRTSVSLPSFISFGRSESSSTKRSSKVKKEKVSTSSTHRSTPSPAPSSKSSEMDITTSSSRTHSPTTEYLEGSSRSQTPSKGTRKTKYFNVVTEKRPDSAASKKKAQEFLDEDVLYTRPLSSKDKFESVTKSASRSNTPEFLERESGTMLREAKTPEPTRDVRFSNEFVEVLKSETGNTVPLVRADSRTTLENLPLVVQSATVVHDTAKSAPVIEDANVEEILQEKVTVAELPKETFQADRRSSLEFSRERPILPLRGHASEQSAEELASQQLVPSRERIIHHVAYSDRDFEPERRTSLEFLPPVLNAPTTIVKSAVFTEDTPPETANFEPDRRSSLQFSRERQVGLSGEKPVEILEESVTQTTEPRERAVHNVPLSDRDFEAERRTSLEFLPPVIDKRKVVIPAASISEESTVETEVPKFVPDRRTSLEFSRPRPVHLLAESPMETLTEVVISEDIQPEAERTRVVHHTSLGDREFEPERRTSLQYLPPILPVKVKRERMDVTESVVQTEVSETNHKFVPDRRTSLEFQTQRAEIFKPIRPTVHPADVPEEDLVEEKDEEQNINQFPRTRPGNLLHRVGLRDENIGSFVAHLPDHTPETLMSTDTVAVIEKPVESDKLVETFVRNNDKNDQLLVRDSEQDVPLEPMFSLTETLSGETKFVRASLLGLPVEESHDFAESRTSASEPHEIRIAEESVVVYDTPSANPLKIAQESVVYSDSSEASPSFKKIPSDTLVREEEAVTFSKTGKSPKERKKGLFGLFKSGRKPTEAEQSSEQTTSVRDARPEPQFSVEEYHRHDEPAYSRSTSSSTSSSFQSAPELPLVAESQQFITSVEPEPEEVLVPRQRPGTVDRRTTVSEPEVTENIARLTLVPIVEPAVVREEMTVISRENWAAPTIAPVAPSRKPKEIIRPLETLEQTITPIESNVPSHTLQSDEESKTVVFSSKKTTEDAPLVQRLVENQAFVSLPVTETVEILSPRNRPGNVHHLVGISDHRITEKTSSMMPDKENLSVVVETDVIPPLITRTLVQESLPEPVAEITRVDTYVRQPVVEEVLSESESVKKEKEPKKSKGLFGIFKRKTSKSSSEVVSETVVQQYTPSPEKVTSDPQLSASTSTDVASETLATTSPFVQQKEVEVPLPPPIIEQGSAEPVSSVLTENEPELIPRRRPSRIDHRGGFPELELTEKVTRLFPEVLVQSPPNVIREVEHVSQVEADTSTPKKSRKIVSFEEMVSKTEDVEPQPIELVDTSEKVSVEEKSKKSRGLFGGLFKSRKDSYTVTQEEPLIEDATYVRETQTSQVEDFGNVHPEVPKSALISDTMDEIIVTPNMVPRSRPANISHRTGAPDFYVTERSHKFPVEKVRTVEPAENPQRIPKEKTVEEFSVNTYVVERLPSPQSATFKVKEEELSIRRVASQEEFQINKFIVAESLAKVDHHTNMPDRDLEILMQKETSMKSRLTTEEILQVGDATSRQVAPVTVLKKESTVPHPETEDIGPARGRPREVTHRANLKDQDVAEYLLSPEGSGEVANRDRKTTVPAQTVEFVRESVDVVKTEVKPPVPPKPVTPVILTTVQEPMKAREVTSERLEESVVASVVVKPKPVARVRSTSRERILEAPIQTVEENVVMLEPRTRPPPIVHATNINDHDYEQYHLATHKAAVPPAANIVPKVRPPQPFETFEESVNIRRTAPQQIMLPAPIVEVPIDRHLQVSDRDHEHLSASGDVADKPKPSTTEYFTETIYTTKEVRPKPVVPLRSNSREKFLEAAVIKPNETEVVLSPRDRPSNVAHRGNYADQDIEAHLFSHKSLAEIPSVSHVKRVEVFEESAATVKSGTKPIKPVEETPAVNMETFPESVYTTETVKPKPMKPARVDSLEKLVVVSPAEPQRTVVELVPRNRPSRVPHRPGSGDGEIVTLHINSHPAAVLADQLSKEPRRLLPVEGSELLEVHTVTESKPLLPPRPLTSKLITKVATPMEVMDISDQSVEFVTVRNNDAPVKPRAVNVETLYQTTTITETAKPRPVVPLETPSQVTVMTHVPVVALPPQELEEVLTPRNRPHSVPHRSHGSDMDMEDLLRTSRFKDRKEKIVVQESLVLLETVEKTIRKDKPQSPPTQTIPQTVLLSETWSTLIEEGRNLHRGTVSDRDVEDLFLKQITEHPIKRASPKDTIRVVPPTKEHFSEETVVVVETTQKPKIRLPDVISAEAELVPRVRPSRIHHRDNTADYEVDSLLIKNKKFATAAKISDDKSGKELTQPAIEYEHITVSRVSTEPVTREPSVEFGISESPMITKDVFVTEVADTVTSAKIIAPQPEKHVVIHHVSTVEKEPKRAPKPSVKVVIAPQSEMLISRNRPAPVMHRTGARDDVPPDFLRKANAEFYEEHVVSISPVKKAARVDVQSSSSSESESGSEHEETVQVRRARPVAKTVVQETDLSEEEFERSHSERVRRVRLQEPPRRPSPIGESRETFVETKKSPEVNEKPRPRPEPVEHFVGETDNRLENWYLTTEPLEKTIVLPVQEERVQEVRENQVESLRYAVPMATETLSEITTIVREVEQKVPKPKPAARRKSQEVLEENNLRLHEEEQVHPEVILLSRMRPERILHRVGVREEYIPADFAVTAAEIPTVARTHSEESIKQHSVEYRQEKPVAVVQTKAAELSARERPERIRHTVGMRDDYVPDNFSPTAAAVLPDVVAAKSRRASKSSTSSSDSERKVSTTTKVRSVKKPKLIAVEKLKKPEEATFVRTDESVEILEKPERKKALETVVTRAEESVLVGEKADRKKPILPVQSEKSKIVATQEREKETVKTRTGTPGSISTSESMTASASRLGTRSKTPESPLKSKVIKVVKTKTPKTSRSNKTEVFEYEDVIYTKPAKNRSKTPDTALRGATIATTRVSSTSPEAADVRAFSLDNRERPTVKIAETVVREEPVIAHPTPEITHIRDETETVVTRQQNLEGIRETPGKRALKKNQSVESRRSSSSSSSSREETEEIVSVTKTKLTSPTPEPRDEVQLVLAEMEWEAQRDIPKEAYNETVISAAHLREESPERMISPPLLHKIPLGDLEFERMMNEKRAILTEPEYTEGVEVISHLKTPYRVHEITPIRSHLELSETMVSHVETEEDRIRRAVGHRDSEIGIHLIEYTSTEKLPSYISFGKLDPDSPQRSGEYRTRQDSDESRRGRSLSPWSPTKILHRSGPKDYIVEIENFSDIGRSLSPWSREKILHRSGPKDYQVEYFAVGTGSMEEPSKPPRRDKETSRDFYSEDQHEGVFREVSRPQQEVEIFGTTTFVRPSEAVENARSLPRTKVSRVESVELSRASSESSTSFVSLPEEREDVKQEAVSPPPDRSLTFSREETAVRARLAPTRERGFTAEQGTSRSVSALSGKSQEFTEEYVDVYRVKFAPDLAEQRTKSPHLFKDPERVHQMKTSTLERGGRPSSSTGRTSSAARSAPGSPGPLGLPYPQPYDFRRTSGPLWENESIMMYGRGMSDTERSDTLSPLKEREMSLGNPLYAKPNRRRIIHTPDSLEDDIVVADVRKVTPEVGGLEFWTTSGGSTSGIEEERVAIREWNIEVPARTRDYRISETATYAEIPMEVYDDIIDDSASSRRPSSVAPAPAIPSRLPSDLQSRRSRSQEAPVYAKIHKRKEHLEEDVFYWKVLKRKNRKSYSAERLRVRSPENNLTPDEIAIMARSVSEAANMKEKGTVSRKHRANGAMKSREGSPFGTGSRSLPIYRTYGRSSSLEDSGIYNAADRERYSVDLRLTTTLDDRSAGASLRRREISKQSPANRSRRLLTVDYESHTPMHIRSFSPSSNEPLSGRESPYDTVESSSAEYLDSRATPVTPSERRSFLADVESETMIRSYHDDADRVYRVAMKEPLPDQHSCLPLYNSLQLSVHEHLLDFEGMILDPDCQYVDQEIMTAERQRFTTLLDGLVRINKNLDRLDDLYRAMINAEPEEIIREIESKQRELNRLYMDLLKRIKSILRRIKHLQALLDDYRKRRLQFKVQLLEELTYFRTHENMTEEDQKLRVNRLLEEVLLLRSATYAMLVRATPEFASRLEVKLHEILMLLRTELRGSIIQLLLTGRYSVEFDATDQKLILSSEDTISEIPTTTSRFSNPTVWSVLRRALPMQALALILLGFASLIPMTDDEFSCLFSNYFASSFNPALRFSGPPPI